MSNKAENKKKLILEKAKALFCEKGYRTVTMKDIVDACEISRGGLYLYYESTREIFLEILKLDSEETDEGFDTAINADSTIPQILGFFLSEQKKELISKTGSLAIASYEFFFENRLPKTENPLRLTFDGAVHVLTDLITAGIERGEIYDTDAKAAARNIMFTLEGLKVGVHTMGIEPKLIDQQLIYMLSELVVPESRKPQS